METENTQVDTSNQRKEGFFRRAIHFCALRRLTVDTVAASLAAGYEAAQTVAVLQNGSFAALDFVNQVGRLEFWLILLCVSAVLCVLNAVSRSPFPSSVALAVLTVVFASVLAAFVSDVWFCIGVLLVTAIVIRYVTREDKLCLEWVHCSRRVAWIATAVGVVLFTGIIGYATICRYRTFSASTFDFGVFAQMFEQMAKTGLPVTTVERGGMGLFSHFGVHFSPIFYLLLPGYLIFRSPEYLLWAQAFFAACGAFFVLGIARKLSLSPAASLVSAFVYLFLPSLSGGCFYDFHENKFLTVCILALMYFLIERTETESRGWGHEILRFLPALGACFLVLSVKEDAAIYVFAVALWVILTQKKKWRGVILFSVALAYFLFATWAIGTLFGGEVMTSRLEAYMASGEEGFLAVIKNCFYDIGYLVSQVFTADKAAYVLWMLIPVVFAPFLNRKQGTLVLLIPMLVINLMPTWKYQYDINYQYTFGVAALVAVCFLLAIADRTPQQRRTLLLLALACGIVMTSALTFPKIGTYVERYQNRTEYYDEIDSVLRETVPADSSVAVNGFLMPHLYYVDDVSSVPLYYGAKAAGCDYVVVDTRYSGNTSYNMEKYYRGYEKIATVGFIEIYQKPQ